MDLLDLWRGKLSPRLVRVRIEGLPHNSALAQALTVDGRPAWGPAEHLLADIWRLTVQANSEKDSLPKDFDHPIRAERAAKEKAKDKAVGKEKFKARKARYAAARLARRAVQRIRGGAE